MEGPRVQAGTVDQAIANGRQLLDRDPASALLQAKTLLRSSPGHPPALRLLAAALRRLGRNAEAERAELEAIRASRFDPIVGRAVALFQKGQASEAEALLEPFLQPGGEEDPVALLLLGEMGGRKGAFRKAEALLERALAAAPSYGEAKVALARLHHAQSRPDLALTLLESALESKPSDIALRRFKATLLAECGQHEAALKLYQALLEDHPHIIALWLSYGDGLRTAGRRAESHDAYRRALALDPAFGRSWWSLASLGHKPFGDGEIAAMEAGLRRSGQEPDNLYHLNFALGSALEAKGDHEAAFRHYDEGNRIRRAMIDHDPASLSKAIDRSTRSFTSAFFASRAGLGDPSPEPIFVLGMPRSGSTLVEQILASHPQVEATAELPIVQILTRTMASDHGLEDPDQWRDLLPEIEPAEFARWGSEYLRRASLHRKTRRPFFVDKMPHNWADLPFILLALPNARIIDIRREPMDCCLSNFRQLFAHGHPASFSLEEMALYYRDYVRMMDHLDQVLPGRIHRIFYENLVEDLEGEVRRMLDHLDLPFDPACLSFHRTERVVMTASSEQVRKPLNRSGIGAWKPFEPWLGPLRDALGDLVDDYQARLSKA